MPADTRPRTVIVRDPDDGPDTTQLLTRLHDLDHGILLVRPAPGTTGLPDLALAMLAALGKNLDARPANPHHWWPMAQAWTIGHRIDHLVVDRAHTLPAGLIHHLHALARTARATIWFVDAHTPGSAPALAGLPDTETAAVHHLPHRTDTAHDNAPQPSPTAQQIPTMAMPCAGFLTFRYACQRHLPADQVQDVDAAWQATFDATQAWLLQTAPYDETMRPPAARIRAVLPSIGAALSARLATLLYTADNQATALLRLRATEAALFRHGLLLRHQPQRAGGHEHLLRCPLTPLAAAIINRTVATNAAAAAALHLIYPLLSADQLHAGEPQSWCVGNLDLGGSRLVTDYGTIPIPAPAHPALQAHLHALRTAGRADADAPLIDQHRHSQDVLAQQVLAPVHLTPPTSSPGYDFRGTYLYRYATAWMADRGLSLHSLADLTPPHDFPLALP